MVTTNYSNIKYVVFLFLACQWHDIRLDIRPVLYAFLDLRLYWRKIFLFILSSFGISLIAWYSHNTVLPSHFKIIVCNLLILYLFFTGSPFLVSEHSKIESFSFVQVLPNHHHLLMLMRVLYVIRAYSFSRFFTVSLTVLCIFLCLDN